MNQECKSSNPYAIGKSSAKWRRSVIALIVLMAVSATAGCTENIDHSSGDKSVDPVPVVSTLEPSSEPSPAASSTSSEVESETPTATTTDPSGDSDEMLIAEARSQLIPLLPESWHVMEDNDGGIPTVATGDLNADGFSDVAAVIEGPEDPTCECSPRSLLLAFGQSDNTLDLSMISDEVVLAADEGGVYGDPFDGIVIERGTLLVSDHGGSNWRWYNRYRFRYQDEAWCLIGYTTGSYFTGTTVYEDADQDDYNLLTGDYILQRTNEEGNVITTKGNRGRKELVKLGEFDLSNM